MTEVFSNIFFLGIFFLIEFFRNSFWYSSKRNRSKKSFPKILNKKIAPHIPRRGLRPQLLDTFGLMSQPSYLVIGYHWLAVALLVPWMCSDLVWREGMDLMARKSGRKGTNQSIIFISLQLDLDNKYMQQAQISF